MIELLVLGATLTVAAWATGAQAHRRSVASRALDRYAQSRGLRFVPPPRTPRGASPRVLGRKDEIDYVIDLYRLGGEMRTRLSCAAARGRAPVLAIAQRDAFAWNESPAFRVDDEAFDAAYLVTTGVFEDVDVLRSTVRALLQLDRRDRVWLWSDGLKVTVSWCGMESDPLILDAARDAAVTVAGWHRPDSPYR